MKTKETKEFKSGDVVQLKSGGPKMTVNIVNRINDQPATVTCQYFNAEDEFKSVNVLEPMLRHND